METLVGKHWHEMSVEDVAQWVETNIEQGLSRFDVKHRQQEFGPNQITLKKKTSPVKRFLLQFHNPLVYILLASAAVTALLAEWVDFSVIFGVVFINAVIGFIQESKAEEALESLRRSVTTTARVLREGALVQVPSAEIVPGEIVWLESGDKVPADLRLAQVREFRIDESALTGESVPVGKTTAPLARDTVLADRTNMAFSGSLVVSGRARGVAIAIGDSTETGRISDLIQSAANLQTPLTKKIAAFSRSLLWVILGLAALTFGVGLLRREPIFEMFMAAVALAVGAIPEGLPAAVTITLAIGVHRMAKRRAIIRKLPAVETLGSTTVICSDKTGTLTENQMTVQAVYAGGARYRVTGQGYAPEGKIHREGRDESAHPGEEPALQQCLLAGALCNDAQVRFEAGAWKVQGDPTEAALLVSARKAGMDPAELARRLPRLDTIPFESERQYMATLHDNQNPTPNPIYVKGSVERVLAGCRDQLDAAGRLATLDPEAVLHEAAQLARNGWRVLALARKEQDDAIRTLECSPEDSLAPSTVVCGEILAGLTFIGLQAMIDPPRAEAIRAVQACRRAGIQVKMITGDHVETAAAIARQLGLAGPDGTVAAINGRELGGMSDAALIEAVPRTTVFARVAPEQKLRLVDALQSLGHVVAMTGDGVNDAPALKQANIGVAMGITGTEVSKEAADMVLTDDNFASIAAAVEEGRGVFANLTKFIVWTLPTNLGEGLVILAAIVAGITLPILPVQILWINMTTALLLGLMLAFEPKEAGLMDRPPRDPRQPIITPALVLRIFLVAGILLIGAFGLFRWELLHGGSVEQARTVAVNIFVMGELFYLFNCRSLERSMFQIGVFTNPALIAGVIGMILLQILFTYLPAMQIAFGSAAIGWREWGWVLGFSMLAYAVIGVEKYLRYRKVKSRGAAARGPQN